MTDSELTMACAHAVGFALIVQSTDGLGGKKVHYEFGRRSVEYNPLHDDAQAMELVKRFGLMIDTMADRKLGWYVNTRDDDHDYIDDKGVVNANLNRAIVECVAALKARTAPAS